MNKLTDEQWRERYIEKIMLNGAVTKELATEIYNNNEHDYDDSPEDAAFTELSYWQDGR